MSEIDALLNEYLSESFEVVQRLSSLIGQVEKSGVTKESIDQIYRDIHTLKGSSQLMGFKEIGQISQVLEASLEPIRNQNIIPSPEFIDQLFKSVDYIERLLKNLSNKEQFAKIVSAEHLNSVANVIESSLKLFLPKLNEKLFQSPALEVKPKKVIPPVAVAPEVKLEKEISAIVAELKPELNLDKNKQQDLKSTENSSQTSDTSTIRVSVSLLDRMMNLVGEMVLVRNQIIQYANQSSDYQLSNLSQKLSLVSGEIQDEVMKTRMQPVGNVVNKFSRLARDLSKDLNKKIEVIIEGAETELDKTLLEAIKDPLTHIIRNSCDHGIEIPEERIKKGKPSTGSIYIRARQESGYVIIEVIDDGKGIDPQKIAKKALEKGLLSASQIEKMNDRELTQIIFYAGFSTAEQVSSVSGRGVGMDVVRTNIEKIGGTIDLSSQVDKGMTLKLKIPLTLAIIPALIVNEKKLSYAIPQMNLVELVRIDQDQVESKLEFLQGQPVFRLRGELLPLASLSYVFEEVTEIGVQKYLTKNKKDINIVVLNIDDVLFGLIVDEVLDTADIVVKPLPQFLKKIQMFSGATIMGDGGLSLILDVAGLAGKTNIKSIDANFKDDIRSNKQDVKKLDLQEMLLFKTWQTGVFSVPLCLVNRLEEAEPSQIERSGGEYLIRYRDGVLPLVSLDKFWNNQDVLQNLNEKISILVLTKLNKFYGLIVREIIDIGSTEGEIEELVKPVDGVYGNVIIDKKVVTVVDALSVIDRISGIEKVKLNKASSTKRKVLVAEDTLFFAKQFIKLFEKNNFEVFHAVNGELAYQILEDKGQGYFNIIVSDIEMPVLNGYEFAKKVKANENFKKIPMIAVTTKFKEQDQIYGKNCGFDIYLEKLNPGQLLESVDNMLGRQL